MCRPLYILALAFHLLLIFSALKKILFGSGIPSLDFAAGEGSIRPFEFFDFSSPFFFTSGNGLLKRFQYEQKNEHSKSVRSTGLFLKNFSLQQNKVEGSFLNWFFEKLLLPKVPWIVMKQWKNTPNSRKFENEMTGFL